MALWSEERDAVVATAAAALIGFGFGKPDLFGSDAFSVYYFYATIGTLGVILVYIALCFGGIALFNGCIAEMETGEGKTVTATLPLYIHALVAKCAPVPTSACIYSGSVAVTVLPSPVYISAMHPLNRAMPPIICTS